MQYVTRAATFLVLLTSCAADAPGNRAVLVRDTTIMHDGTAVDVRIVENDADADVAVWRVRAAPELDLGSPDGPEEELLYRVRGAYRLDDGRIAVADGGSSTIKLFDATGAFLRSFGGEGAGPGEFRTMQYFARMRDDSLAVFDRELRRLTVFDSEGQRAREISLGMTSSSPFGSVLGIFDDGSLLLSGFVAFGEEAPSGLLRPATEVFHLNADGTLADSLGSFPSFELFYIRMSNGGFTWVQPPFQRTSARLAAGTQFYYVDTEHSEVQVMSSSGVPLQFIRWRGARPALSEADLARARDWMLAEEVHSPQYIERLFQEVPQPSTLPALQRLRIDRADNLWVQMFMRPWETRSAPWLVFSPDGLLIARLELPQRLVPADIGDDYIVERDELDVEHVRLYRLERADTLSNQQS